MVYCECGKTFASTHALEQHKKDKNLNRKAFACPICCRSFSRPYSLTNHQISKDHGISQEEKANALGDKVCECGKVCRSAIGLEQHMNSNKHFKRMANLRRKTTTSVTVIKMPSKLQEHIEFFYVNNVKVTKDDRTESVATVRETLSTIMEYVRREPGGEIYNPSLTKAGSHAVHTKIGKADEFDWGVALNVTTQDMMSRTTGSIPYTIDAQDNNMNIDLTVDDTHSSIPTGYAAVSLRPEANVPRNLMYGSYMIPRFVKRDLYNKIKTSLEDSGLASEGVHITRESHGPALTLTIMPPKAYSHHISIDIVPSLPSYIPLTSSGWPRRATIRAFTQERTEAAKNAGTHLVPKKDAVFDISYSKAERALLEDIDSNNKCRKKCHQVIKKYVKSFTSLNSASGISSHIFKQQLLNMIEAHPEPGYWDNENFGVRVVDMLRDCENKLREGRLPNHFVSHQNVLEGKDRRMLNTLADFFKEKRTTLENL